jgi:hypothetical protein
MSVVVKFPRRLTVVGYCWHPYCGEVLYREVPHDDVEGLCWRCSRILDEMVAAPALPVFTEAEIRDALRAANAHLN